MVKRPCLLCCKSVEERLLRRTKPNSHHTVVLLSSLLLFNATDLSDAKRCYAACIRLRQRICDQHYIDAAQLIASEMACVGISLTTYVDPRHGVVVSYSNEKDIPLHLLDSIEENARKLSAELVVTTKKVSGFLNYCLSRYRVEVLRAAVSTDHQRKATVSSDEVRIAQSGSDDKKTVNLLFSTSQTPEMIAVGPDRSSSDPPVCPDGDELDVTDPDLLNSNFIVKGDRLLSLFRFCPECGTEISTSKRNVMLSQEGQTPIVLYICSSCRGKQCWYGI
ncbi:hypothetical protein RB195_001708 [Necator americanus]|uniref:Uncharacterized protein n=2 Tax=Necator americanus TaxID=51031 RepID=W2TKX1_NECAM|nr:hypothetical protein NECAME_02076 [Necator americanus]ETN81786.1 hypothetical protein NECAME_02076 [Necator americanus]